MAINYDDNDPRHVSEHLTLAVQALDLQAAFDPADAEYLALGVKAIAHCLVLAAAGDAEDRAARSQPGSEPLVTPRSGYTDDPARPDDVRLPGAAFPGER